MLIQSKINEFKTNEKCSLKQRNTAVEPKTINVNGKNIPEDVFNKIHEELWGFYFSQGCRAVSQAYEGWCSKPPSDWPEDVRKNIFNRGVLDLIADTRKYMDEMQDVIMRIDMDVKSIKNSN